MTSRGHAPRRWTFVAPARPAWVERSPNSHWYSVAGICFGALMVQLDSSIVALALPSMQRSFDASLASVQWVSVAYVLTTVALVAPAARLGDAFGRKTMYLYGYAIFTVSSLLCSIAPDLLSLIAFRVIQGIGGAAIAGNAIAMVRESMPKEKLRDGLAVQASMQSLGLALGPLLGGFLVDDYGWRSIFWVNVPIGVLALASAFVLLPGQRRAEGTSELRFDWYGTLLLAVAAVGLMVGLSGISGLPLATGLSVLLLVSPLLTVPAFWARERRAAAPVIDPPTLRSPEVSLGAAGAFISYLLLIAPTVLIPQVLIPSGHSVSSTGVILSSMPVGFLIATVASTTWLRNRGSNRMRAALGCAVIIASIVVLATHSTNVAWIVAGLAAFGLGLGMYVPANNASVMVAASARGTGTAGSLIAMFRNTGVATGVAVITLTLHIAGHDSRRDATDTSSDAHAALLHAVNAAWIVLLLFALLAAAGTAALTVIDRRKAASVHGG